MRAGSTKVPCNVHRPTRSHPLRPIIEKCSGWHDRGNWREKGKRTSHDENYVEEQQMRVEISCAYQAPYGTFEPNHITHFHLHERIFEAFAV